MKAWSYVYRGMRGNRRRHVLGASAIALSTTIMIAIGVVFAGGQSEFRQFFERAYAYDFEVAPVRQDYNATYFEAGPVVSNISKLDGVEGTYPLLTTVLFTPAKDNLSQRPLLVYGSEPGYKEGRVKSLGGKYELGPGQTVLSKPASKKLGLGLGRTLVLRTLFTSPPVELRLNITGVLDVEGRFMPGVDEYAVVGFDHLGQGLNLSGKATSLLVVIDDSLYDLGNPADPVGRATDLGNRIALMLGPSFMVTSMKGFIIKQSVQGTSFFGIMVYVFSVFFPAIAGIMVSSLLNLSVEDKAHDLAVLRLLGARRWAVARILLVELAMIVALGLPVGIALGILLPYLRIGELLKGADPLSILVTILIQVGITLGVLLVFAVKPLQRALRSDPIDAVRKSRVLGALKYQVSGGIDRRVPLAGFVLFSALAYATLVIPYILIFSSGMEIVFYLLVSVMVMLVCLSVATLVFSTRLETALVAAVRPATRKVNVLAQRSLVRYARRNISTNVIFGVVVAILIFFTSLISTVRGSIEDTARYESGADIRVRSVFEISESQILQLLEIPGIERGAGVGPPREEVTVANLVGPTDEKLRIYPADRNFSKASYVSQADFHQGGPGAFDLGNGSIIISRSVATALDVDAGDVIRVELEQRRSFLTVKAVLNSLPGFPFEVSQTGRITNGEAAFVSFEQYRWLANQSFSTKYYTSLFLKLSPGADAEKVGELVASRFADLEGFRVSITKVNVENIVEATAFLDVIFSAVLLGMLMVAVFSLMSNLYASIKEREFEMGVLRAVGFRRSQVLASLLAEGLAVAIGAVLLGIFVGLVVGYMMVWFIGILSAMGWRFVLPLSIIALVIGVAAGASALGVYLTARGVVRRELIDLVKRTE